MKDRKNKVGDGTQCGWDGLVHMEPSGKASAIMCL